MILSFWCALWTIWAKLKTFSCTQWNIWCAQLRIAWVSTAGKLAAELDLFLFLKIRKYKHTAFLPLPLGGLAWSHWIVSERTGSYGSVSSFKRGILVIPLWSCTKLGLRCGNLLISSDRERESHNYVAAVTGQTPPQPPPHLWRGHFSSRITAGCATPDPDLWGVVQTDRDAHVATACISWLPRRQEGSEPFLTSCIWAVASHGYWFRLSREISLHAHTPTHTSSHHIHIYIYIYSIYRTYRYTLQCIFLYTDKLPHEAIKR